MRFCPAHWSALRAAVDARGLSALVSEDGETAARNLQLAMAEGVSVDTFDPLMGAHNAIMGNAMRTASQAGGQAGVAELMCSDACPVCLLTTKHAEACHDPDCQVKDYDHWIDRAADDMLAQWKALGTR